MHDIHKILNSVLKLWGVEPCIRSVKLKQPFLNDLMAFFFEALLNLISLATCPLNQFLVLNKI